MAAQAWKAYNKAIKKIGNGTIDLSATTFRIVLVNSAANFATKTLSLLGSLTGELTEQNGYSSSGKALASEVWTVGTTANSYKFDAADITFTASGGAYSNVKGACIITSGASAGACHMVFYASLTGTGFDLSSGSTMTIQFASGGIYTISQS